MRRLALRTEALAELTAGDLLHVSAGELGPPTETKLYLLCVFTHNMECQSVFHPCYSNGCTE